MKIGVLSDTHLRSPDRTLDFILEDLLGDADMILHAGDIVGRSVLEYLEEREVIAVCGNMDDYEIVGSVPQTRIISAAGKRIGLIHGWGGKVGLERRIAELFAPHSLDVIVYGHSHKPFWGEVNGVRMFNPGSAATRHLSGKGTVGILEIDGDGVDGQILAFDGQ